MCVFRSLPSTNDFSQETDICTVLSISSSHVCIQQMISDITDIDLGFLQYELQCVVAVGKRMIYDKTDSCVGFLQYRLSGVLSDNQIQ